MAAVVAVAAGGGVRPGVIGQVAPEGKERAKTAVGRGQAADFGIGLGLDAVRRCGWIRRWPSGSPGARRAVCRGAATLRTNLWFIGRRVVPQLYPADMPLPREHAKGPYSPAKIAGYPALADAEPPQRGGCGSPGCLPVAPAPG